MDVVSTLVLFILGFFVLIKGAEILVHGAVNIAHVFKVSTWFIGAVVVSIGTSLPELSINVASVLDGNEVGIATLIGSNIFNILFVLGIMAILTHVTMHQSWIKRDLVQFLLITIFVGIVIGYPVLGDASHSGVSFEEALLLLGVFVVWLTSMVKRWDESHEDLDFEVVTLFGAIVFVGFGILGVFFGGQWVVNGAILIAELAGVSPAIVGFTIVALGTSLPELVVSLAAINKGTVGIAVGNIVGSSIFNFLGVLGVTALIRPIPVQESMFFDVSFVVVAAVLWFIFMFTGKKLTLSRPEGIVFLLLYALFVFSLFVR